MTALLWTPLLVVALHAAPDTGAPAGGVAPVQSKVFGGDGPVRDDDDDIEAPVDPDGPVGGFAKACGTTCLVSCGLWALSTVLLVVPGVGWLGSLGVQLLNPVLSGLAGWAALNAFADRRAPLLSQVLGMAAPFYAALALNLVGGAILTAAASALALVLVLAGSALVLGSTADSNPVILMVGALGTGLAAAIIPTAALVVVGAVGLVLTGLGVCTGSLLSSVLGVALGRGFTSQSDTFEPDLFRSPGPRPDRVPRRKPAPPPVDGAPPAPADPAPAPPPPAPEAPPTSSF